MSFNCLQELANNWVFGLLALENIWVLIGLVSLLYFIKIQNTVPIFVALLESLSDQISSVGAQRSSDCIKELLDTQSTIVVSIEQIKEDRNILWADTDLEISASFGKFSFWKWLGLIVIHDVENSLETDDTSGSTSLNFISE